MNTKKRDGMKNLYKFIANLMVVFSVTVLFIYIWYVRYNSLMDRKFVGKGNLLVIGLYVILLIVVYATFGGFQIGVNKFGMIGLSQAIGLFIVDFIELLVLVLMIGWLDYTNIIVGGIVLLYFSQLVVTLVLTSILCWLYTKIFPPYQVLHIFGQHKNSLTMKMNSRSDKYEIAGETSCDDSDEKIRELMGQFDAVLLNDIPSERRNDLLKICFDLKKRVYFTPKISDIMVKQSTELTLFDTPLFLMRNRGMNGIQRFIKRLGDIIISLIGIIITSPIMGIAAILIHAYDKGPVLYKQKRCTIDGKVFEICKFRSMITDAEADGKARLAQENDDRITPIGKFIRATRIDELPQFFNILKGEMSVVGPRPERPEIVAQYCESVPEFAYRTRVKAGLTGYAQVFGKYNTTSYDKLKMDMIYVERCSVLLDIQLILLTLRVVLTKEATEGLEEGATTADVSGDKEE